MATVAGVVFSITIVALQLASSQFGPHVLRSFLADKINQVSLGTFVACVLYAFFVILAVRDQAGFVPVASTYMGMVITAGALFVLILFISHVADSIRIESVINAIARDIRDAMAQIFPEELGEGEEVEREEPPQRPLLLEHESKPITLRGGGYIRRLDDPTLMQLAAEYDLMIWLLCRPGDFIVNGGVVMHAAPASRLTAEIERKLANTAVVGLRRTPDQDISYALQELAEIAIRALSPGINAPFNATPCIDFIGDALVRLARRRIPSLVRCDEAGKARVLIARAMTLAEVTRTVLGPIASAGRSHAVVMAHLIKATLTVADRAPSHDREDLRALASSFAQEAASALPSERERKLVEHALKDEQPPAGLIR